MLPRREQVGATYAPCACFVPALLQAAARAVTRRARCLPESHDPMRELLLLRHAKSSWNQPGVPDHERDLAPRGIAAAERMGDLLQELGLVPDRILCSTARRTVRTWELAGTRLLHPPAVTWCEALYLAAPDRILGLVRGEGVAARRLLLVGHNPGMHQLANRLTGAGAPAPRARLAEKFPTAGLARLVFAIASWAELAPGSGELTGFWRPRDLGGPAG
jgi:phosphohistidine phosphatase